VNYCNRRLRLSTLAIAVLLLACISVSTVVIPIRGMLRVHLNSESTLRPARVINEAKGCLEGEESSSPDIAESSNELHTPQIQYM